jgi:predicted ATP-grasp superfamily ATP-dependent carboligase
MITRQVETPDESPRQLSQPTAGPDANGRTGAVVIGGDYLGLGIVRSLGRRGIPVCVVDDERSIAGRSRYTTHRVHVADLRDPDVAVTELLDAGRRLGLEGWVLYPTRDETVAALSRNRDVLATLFRVPVPPWEVIRWAWDKGNTYQLASSLGVPTPRTWYPRTVRDLDDIDGEPPYALKPGIKEKFYYATKAKAWRANSRRELVKLFRQATDVVGEGGIMVQEIIPGGGEQQFAYGAFCRDGQPIGSMTARRRRQHPPEFGRASTYVETVIAPEVVAYSERLLREIGYYGLVELEYKLDPRDGVYKLLDFNARAWGYHSVGQRAGVDFPYLVFADQVGLPIERQQAAAGVHWLRIVTDTPTALVELVHRNLSLGDYLRSLRAADTEAVFSRDDPLPFIIELVLIPYLMMVRGF